MEFYSVVMRKKISIPDVNVREVVKGGRRFAVGKYKIGAKEYEAWRILGKKK
jgi:hypothetical protein